MREKSCQRRGAALVLGLRKERHVLQLGARVRGPDAEDDGVEAGEVSAEEVVGRQERDGVAHLPEDAGDLVAGPGDVADARPAAREVPEPRVRERGPEPHGGDDAEDVIGVDAVVTWEE